MKGGLLATIVSSPHSGTASLGTPDPTRRQRALPVLPDRVQPPRARGSVPFLAPGPGSISPQTSKRLLLTSDAEQDPRLKAPGPRRGGARLRPFRRSGSISVFIFIFIVPGREHTQATHHAPRHVTRVSQEGFGAGGVPARHGDEELPPAGRRQVGPRRRTCKPYLQPRPRGRRSGRLNRG